MAGAGNFFLHFNVCVSVYAMGTLCVCSCRCVGPICME